MTIEQNDRPAIRAQALGSGSGVNFSGGAKGVRTLSTDLEFKSVFDRLGVAVKARKSQILDLGKGADTTLYLVHSGVLMLSADGANERRQMLMLLYPGDVFASDLAPPLEGIGLTALTDAKLRRLRTSTLIETSADAEIVKTQLVHRYSELNARAGLHVVRLASLSSEARVAAFILEIGLRMGRISNDSLSCELPLSRQDIADYLSLNADTLSRIMTRLKSQGLVATVGRSRAIVKSIKKLCKDLPICSATMALHGGAGKKH